LARSLETGTNQLPPVTNDGCNPLVQIHNRNAPRSSVYVLVACLPVQ
jgi:hypothetical protein